MWPGPGLLLLGLGLGLGVPGAPAETRRPPPTAGVGGAARGEAGALRSVSGSLGLGLLGGHVRLRLRPRAAPGGGVVLSGGRGLCVAPGSRQHCLHVRAPLRRAPRARRAAPTPVDLHLSAPRSLLSLRGFAPLQRSSGPLAWTFHLGQVRPRGAASAFHAAPRSGAPGGPRPYTGFPAQTKCPTPVDLEAVNSDGSQARQSSVSCQWSAQVLCVIKKVKINTKKDGAPLVLTRKMEASLSATSEYDCPLAKGVVQRWSVFSVPSVAAVPDWTNPLAVPELWFEQDAAVVHIPKNSLTLGVYVFRFSVVVATMDPKAKVVRGSDHIYVTIVRSLLKAVLLGDSNITVHFTDRLVLDGSTSSDPDADDPLEGLHFFWYCTTNPRNYDGGKISLVSKEVCLPAQADLRWTWASGPELVLLPETLKGDRAYFFRMVIQKSDRTAYSDKRVHVLRGPTPTATISCIENCDKFLVVSDRFSLFLNCTNCAPSRDVYKWSLLSPVRNEMRFDWMGQTTTGRNSRYLSIKAFAFRHFFEAQFWISLDIAAWSGATLVLWHPFIINHAPEIGECKINPAAGIAFFTKFVVQCSNFKDQNLPLSYKMIVSDLHGFAKISSVRENTLGSIMYMGSGPTSPPSFLPVGVLANHYAMKIYVQVYDSLGALSQVTLYATVQAPTEKNSSKTVLQQLLGFAMGPNAEVATLLQKRAFLPAGYLLYIVASVLNSIKSEPSLQADKFRLREHLVNQSFTLPVRSLVEINQVVMVIAKLTQEPSEFTRLAQKRATARAWQANEALQQHQRRHQQLHTEQIDIVSTGLLTSLSNILKMTVHHEVIDDPFYILVSLADTILTGKVPGNETTVIKSTSFNIYAKKMENWIIGNVLGNEKHCRNCFHPVLNVSSVPTLSANAPISMMFCEFADDPFPWLNDQDNLSADVVGFRMTGTTAHGDVIEITPEVAEVYLGRKNLSFAAFNLTVGPDNEPNNVDESLRKTTGAFRFEVDSTAVREVLIHIVTEVTVLFTVLVYAGTQITPTALVATFLAPHDIPPITNQSDLFDPACTVKVARVVCLPPSLLQAIAQRSHSPECAITVVLHAPRFVIQLHDKLVRISLFSVHCLDMYGVQSDWREDACVLGEKTTWDRVHCVCKKAGRTRRQLSAIKQASIHLHAHYLTAKVIVVPNPIDLRLEVIKDAGRNPVAILTVLFIMVMYIVLAFWAWHRDAIDHFLRELVIVLPDNDPYDNACYLVTIFTGSRCGSGTRANVFVQLRGTESTSDVHCLSHPHFTTLCRGSVNTFLVTTQSDLGDIHSIRVWHDNEGKAPSWYLSRIKVENLFSRHIWLFMCRTWLSVDTSVDRTFRVTDPDEPLERRDFFLIEVMDRLRRKHMWLSVFAGVVREPFSRLQRLSCCLAVLLCSLMCNIMFFNLKRQEETELNGTRYIRSMARGLESVLITIPVQLTITFFFTYSQRKPQVTLDEVSPQKRPLTSAASGHWEERLEKWHAEEAAKAAPTEAGELPPRTTPTPCKATLTTGQPHKKAESKVSQPPRTNTSASDQSERDGREVHAAEPAAGPGPPPAVEKPRFVLPWWCVYIAWFLVFAACSVSSVFIILYGLTYGYEKSMEWLFASFCSFCQSVFLVQPCKIILLSSIRTTRLKYCKNISWVSNYHYSVIELQDTRLHPDEMRKRHEDIARLRASRMYQPLTEDEIRIFQRKERVKSRAVVFLGYILTHFIFLALLLSLAALLHSSDSFHYNRFIRDQFSVGLATVTKLDDIYRWLSDVLLPLFHNNLNPTFLPDSSSKILGLPLMRQLRAKPARKACLPANELVPNSIRREMHCRPTYGTDPEDTKDYTSFWNKVDKQAVNKNAGGFTYKPPAKRWVYHSYGLLHTYGSGGYAFYFFPDQQQFNSSVRLKELQSSTWLDENTWAVILDLTTFNPDVRLFCSISVLFEVSQLGVVNTSTSVHSFALADFDRKRSAEIYLYVALLVFFLAYTVEEVYIIMQERASYVRGACSWLSLAHKCMLAALIVLFLQKHFLATRVIHFYLSNSMDFIPFHTVSHVDHTLRVVLGFLLFLTILKTLRYSRFFYDVRLAQRATQTTLPGICHMALVVSVYFFMYTAFGYLVFGQHEWNYSNLAHATQTIFSYCVSAFQNTEFSHNRVLGLLFLSSFILLMICVLINLFRAVILSAYGDMKQPVYEEPSHEAEAMAYLCSKLRTLFGFLSFQSQAESEPEFLVDMLYGQPGKNSHRYLGLKTRSINGKKMVYLVV